MVDVDELTTDYIGMWIIIEEYTMRTFCTWSQEFSRLPASVPYRVLLKGSRSAVGRRQDEPV